MLLASSFLHEWSRRTCRKCTGQLVLFLGESPVKSKQLFFCTSGDAMCAVCTGHLLLRFETPRTQEAKTGKTTKQKKTKPPNKTTKPKQKQRARTSEFHLCTSEVRHGEKGTAAVCYLGHEFKFKLLLRVVDSYARRLCAIGLCVDRPNHKHLLAQVLKLDCSLLILSRA